MQSYGIDGPMEAGLNLFIDDGLSSRPNSKVMLDKEVKLVGVSTCRHEATNAKIVVIVLAKEFTLNAYGTRRIAGEHAYRKKERHEEKKKEKEEKKKNKGRKLKTSEFLRQLKSAQSSGVLPYVASTFMALGCATAMAMWEYHKAFKFLGDNALNTDKY